MLGPCLVLAEKSFSTSRLVLEPLQVNHAALLFDGFKDPALYQYIPQEPPASVAALEESYLRRSARRSPDNLEVWLNWAIRLNSENSYIGLVQSTVRGDCAKIAYFTFKPFQRMGYAQEAVGYMLHALLNEGGLSRLDALIDTRNASSIRLVESLGFSKDSIIKEADFFKGHPSDEFRYSLFKTENDKSNADGTQ